MRFPLRRSLPSAVSTQAFTLIELLVVISIIAVLAGLLLPVGNKVIENSKKVSAKTTMLQIVSAVKNYQSEYGTYPVAISASAGATAVDTTFDDTAAAGGTAGKGGQNKALFSVLRALNNSATETDPAVKALNARRISYFEYKDVKNAASPKDGFVPAPTGGGAATSTGARGVSLSQGDLVDPWGSLYYVRVDTGYSDRVVDPFLEPDTADDASTTDDSKVVHTSVIAWTLGSGEKQFKQTTGAGATTFETSGNVSTWR